MLGGKVTGMSKNNTARAFLILILSVTLKNFFLLYVILWNNYHTHEIRFVGILH